MGLARQRRSWLKILGSSLDLPVGGPDNPILKQHGQHSLSHNMGTALVHALFQLLSMGLRTRYQPLPQPTEG